MTPGPGRISRRLPIESVSSHLRPALVLGVEAFAQPGGDHIGSDGLSHKHRRRRGEYQRRVVEDVAAQPGVDDPRKAHVVINEDAHERQKHQHAGAQQK